MASLPEFITRELVLKFLKFGMVGFSGLVVDFGITWLFKEKIKIERFIANAIGFSVAATSNYFLNRIWTYESHNPKVMVEFTQFFIIAMMGLVINTIIIWLLDRKFSFNFYLAKLIAIGVVTLWNFMANTYITFA
ncbi:MAG: GtrA family protein [Bacteroidales bacterium]|nr:GtrA family protein [Bacteroidales bacterium]MDD3664334.1 GtrA family protein [Bacteroidales bacterium]